MLTTKCPICGSSYVNQIGCGKCTARAWFACLPKSRKDEIRQTNLNRTVVLGLMVALLAFLLVLIFPPLAILPTIVMWLVLTVAYRKNIIYKSIFGNRPPGGVISEILVFLFMILPLLPLVFSPLVLSFVFISNPLGLLIIIPLLMIVSVQLAIFLERALRPASAGGFWGERSNSSLTPELIKVLEAENILVSDARFERK